MFCRQAPWLWGLAFGARTVLDGKNYLSNLDLLPFLDPDFFYRPGYGGWHFDHSLVRFQFHDWLAFSHAGARRNHQANQVALINVLAEFR